LRHDDVLRAADESLRALGTDYLDLYQIHFPNDEVPLEETCAALEALVDAGKVRFIGVSNFSVTQLQRAQKAMRKHPIVSNQVRYHLADRVIECGLLSYCQASHVTVIAYSPLGHELQRIRDRDPGRVLDEVAQAAGKTAPQVMLNWCLCRDGVVVIPKASSIDHVLEDCGASGWRLTAGQCARLNATFSFRCKSPAEVALRRLVSPLGPFVKPCFQKLPPPLRRWVE